MRFGLSLISLVFLALASASPISAGVGECGGDCDGVADNIDNCLTVPNGPAGQNQCDTDQDGYGNICDADTTNDGVVGAPDFATFTACFGVTTDCVSRPECCAADTTCDGVVGAPDFATYTANFGGLVGPSGLSCAGTIPCP